MKPFKGKQDAKVVDRGLWKSLVHAGNDLYQRYEALREAAQYRRVPSTNPYASPGATDLRAEDQIRLRQMRRDLDQIELAILAMENGRDPRKPRTEILSCFDKKGRHQLSTIARRYFGVDHPEGEDWVKEHLRYLIKRGRIATGRHKRTFDHVYLLVTPERQAKWKAEKAEKEARAAERKAAKNRQASVLTALKALGCRSAKSEAYSTGRVLLAVEDVEALIALASSKECA